MVKAPSASEIWRALDEVTDPEIPVISIVELGIVRHVEVHDDRVTVRITPTFAGCPALEAIKNAVEERLRELKVGSYEVVVDLSAPWTSDFISDSGRVKLKSFGLAPPVRHGGNFELQLLEVVPCPYCGSTNTRVRNAFGSTPCRAIHYCRACQQPFEQFKPL